MSRPRPGFYNTIEYIGPRPQKPKRRNFFGGWVILVIAVGIGYWYGRPYLPLANAAQPTTEQAAMLSASLNESASPADKLSAAALSHTLDHVVKDPSYYKIPYPNGDIAPGKGAAADVIIRCYRKLGIDLQKEVHEDMAEHFRLYPQLWNSSAPDTNIDHRRIANLQRFFERKGQTLPASREARDYRPGDIVVWSLANADTHIGIVVPSPGNNPGESWVVHNLDNGVKWEPALFNYKIEGHFRYPTQEPAAPKEK